jgi:Ca-activated chloride channel family protein
MKNSLLSLLALVSSLGTPLFAAGDALTLRVAPEREWLVRGASREVLVQVELEGRRPEQPQRTPMNLALVLDRSGSMAGAKLEKARQAACVAIDQLGPDDFVSLIVYDNNAEVLVPSQKLDSRDRDAIKRRIERIQPGGGTAIYSGVQLGAQQLRKHLDRERVNRVILLSDGIANVGPSRTSDLTDLGRHLRQDGMSVSTIGLGDDYNEDLMAGLAEASAANYYYVQDSEKLPKIFEDELGSARSIVARSVTIRIQAPKGVRIREILGHPEIVCGDNLAEITLPEYFGTLKRRFLARCEVTEGRTESTEVAAVELKYEDSASGKSAQQEQKAVVRFTEETAKSEASIQSEVAKEANVWRNRDAKERALKLAEEGKPQDAAKVIRQQLAAYKAAPVSAKPAAVSSDIRALEAVADTLEVGRSLPKGVVKQMKAESFQDKNASRAPLSK